MRFGLFPQTNPFEKSSTNKEERNPPVTTKSNNLSPLKLFKPTTLFESNGELYIVASGQVLKVLRNGHHVIIAGDGSETKEGAPAHQSQLNGPFGIFVSHRNEVFITEREGNRIRKIDKDGNMYTIAGTGQAGDIGDGIATKCQLREPTGIIVTELDQIIFVDHGNGKIRMIQPDGMLKTLVNNIGGNSIKHLCMDEMNGTIYLAERNAIQKILPNNGGLEIVERKPVKQVGLIHPFTEQKFHQIYDVRARNGMVYYSDRLFLRRVDTATGNDCVLARIESVQRPLARMTFPDPYVSICLSSCGNGVYMSDDVRGTVWRLSQIKPNFPLKELMCKCKIPFNFTEHFHSGSHWMTEWRRNGKNLLNCNSFHDVCIINL